MQVVTNYKPTHKGLPQAAVSSTSLINIMINDLLHKHK